MAKKGNEIKSIKEKSFSNKPKQKLSQSSRELKNKSKVEVIQDKKDKDPHKTKKIFENGFFSM